MDDWSTTIHHNLRALRYWRLLTDGLAVLTVLVAGLGALLWFFGALPTP